MKHTFIRFPSGRTFLPISDIEKARNKKRSYIMFFDEEFMMEYFDINPAMIHSGYECFYASPTKSGIEKITKKDGNYFVFLSKKKELQELCINGIFPNIEGCTQHDYLLFSEESSGNNTVVDIPDDICPVFFIYAMNQSYPVVYSPFSYHKIPFEFNKANKEILSFGNESAFTIAYLVNNEITVSPNFGELESLYEIDAMDIMVNSIMGHLQFKNITIARDYNNYSMIADYTSKFSHVKKVSHIFSHLANVMFEHQFVDKKGIGVIFDGISYDAGDQLLGGEILYGNIGNYRVAGGWKPIPLPGGDIANIEPWRITLAVIKEFMKGDITNLDIPIVKALKKNKNYSFIFNAINQDNINFTMSSSMHHIISALGELLSYEETTYDQDYFENKMDKILDDKSFYDDYSLPIIEEDDKHFIYTHELFQKIVFDILAKVDPELLVQKALSSIACATCDLVELVSKKYHEKNVFLSGELFKHPHFLNLVHQELIKRGLTVYIPKNIPVDDSGISIGQLIYQYFE